MARAGRPLTAEYVAPVNPDAMVMAPAPMSIHPYPAAAVLEVKRTPDIIRPVFHRNDDSNRRRRPGRLHHHRRTRANEKNNAE